MIYYIAGPMSGIPDGNRPAFHRAAAGLRAEGHTVLDPALLPMDLDDKAYLPICTAMIDAADAIYMLDGWATSMGAVAEQNYAMRQGKHVRYAVMHPVGDPLEDACIEMTAYCALDDMQQKLTAALKERDEAKAALREEQKLHHNAIAVGNAAADIAEKYKAEANALRAQLTQVRDFVEREWRHDA